MLDARRAKQKGYITLKEAAEKSKYNSDYIGQLIRSGKIKGEQVYCSVAWVTTEAEVRRYEADQNGTAVVRSSTTQPVARFQVKMAPILLGFLLLLPLVTFLLGMAGFDTALADEPISIHNHAYK